jgi:biotin synthase
MGLCCGGLFGMGETWADRIDLALTLRDVVEPDVVPLNFLNPIQGTPLGTCQPLPAMEALTVVAMFRLAMPTVDLKLAGGREINLRSCQSWIFHAGATSFLVGNYLTTFGQDPAADHQMVRDLGFEVVRTW